MYHITNYNIYQSFYVFLTKSIFRYFNESISNPAIYEQNKNHKIEYIAVLT